MRFLIEHKFVLMFELPKERPITFEQIISTVEEHCDQISRVDYSEEWRYVLGYWEKKTAVADARALHDLIAVKMKCADPKIIIEKNISKQIDWKKD